jgi:hypothetical protein
LGDAPMTAMVCGRISASMRVSMGPGLFAI